MNTDIGHERCSELLRDHLTGKLGRKEAAAVEAHLATCEGCRRERSALEALTVAAEPMTDIERARLHKAVAGAIEASEPSAARPPRRQTTGWRARLMPALGAAALIAVIAVGIASLDLTGTGEDDSSGAGGEAPLEVQDEAIEQAAPAGEAKLAFPVVFEAARGSLTERDLTELGKAGFAPPVQEFSVEDGDTEKGGVEGGDVSAGSSLRAIAPAPSRRALRTARNAHFNYLVTQAPDDAVAQQIVACIQVVQEQWEYPLVPAYGALARFEGRDVLVIGFRWRLDNRSPLDRFLVWTWPRSGSCDLPVDYRSGRIRS